jgi:hypothetical protein
VGRRSLAALAAALACQSGPGAAPESSCEPFTCAGEGWQCGLAGDGCGAVLDCGACAAGTCSANTCACAPLDCAALIAGCGPVDDGCGAELDCGTCAGTFECAAGACALPGPLVACDEAGFCWQSPHPVPFSPLHVVQRAADDIWAVGRGGQIRRWDGIAWRSLASGTGEDLFGVWAASASDAWAVGARATLLHFDGAAWSPVDVGATGDLLAVHGSAADDVWVVGDDVALRWDGASWSPASNPPRLAHVWVVEPGRVFATGERRVWEWSDTSWVPVTPYDDRIVLAGVAGRSASEVFAIGSLETAPGNRRAVLYRHDGDEWTEIGDPDADQPIAIYATAEQVVAVHAARLEVLAGEALPPGTPPDIAVAGGSTGAHVVIDSRGAPWRSGPGWHGDLTGERRMLVPVGTVAGAVWFAAGPDLFASRSGGLVPTARPPGPVLAVHGAGEVLAVVLESGDAGRIHRLEAGIWTQAGPADVRALASAGDSLYAAGERIHRKSGATWLVEHEAPGRFWRALGGEATPFAAGQRTDGKGAQRGVVARRIAGAWIEEEVPGTSTLCDLAVIAPDDIWVAGWRDINFIERRATLSHFDGSSWTTEDLTEGSACSVRAAPGAITAVAGGALWRRTGTGWLRWLDHPVGRFTGAELDGAGVLWLAGSDGALVTWE